MPKIIIKRNSHTIKVQPVNRNVSLKQTIRKVTIRSASKRGLPGPEGDQGDEGKSAYQVWLGEGNVGTEQDFFDSLRGVAGPTGGNYSQSFNGATVVITHNLGYIPNLTMYDTAGDEIEGAIIERDNNHFTVQFSATTSGTAHCS
jgi:hypothetical protein